MTELTKKQKDARAYYQQNKARICKQKRDAYAKRESKKVKSQGKREVKKGLDDAKQPAVESGITKTKKSKVPIRRRYEDIKLAQELGISVDEL